MGQYKVKGTSRRECQAEEIIQKKTTSLELAAVKISTDGKGFTAPWKRKEYNTIYNTCIFTLSPIHICHKIPATVKQRVASDSNNTY